MNIKEAVEELQKRKDPIRWKEATAVDAALKTYTHYYNLPTDVKYGFGTYETGDFSIKVQEFTPKDTVKKTVLVLHGYLDHTGALSPLIRYLTALSCRVVSFDLIGHGLSEGERYGIDQFEDYSDSVISIVSQLKQVYKTDIDVIAHSTGAAAVLNGIFQKDIFHKTILLAPLIRPAHWSLVRVSHFCTKHHITTVRRTIRNNTSNKSFKREMKKDPLQYRELPVSWVTAMIRWNVNMKRNRSATRPIVIIQGEKDKTVDWRFNCTFICERFPNTKVYFIEKGKHQLINERAQIQLEVFEQIRNELF
ncbi:alpha/beta hydrolase [Alkalihalobacterium bogoriense]|uniref:alpha/beta hydrolase n=1 Tax=Alkalihalobacterium bogoriense TaxID=246272 RepID=UPI00047D05B1|nr:alpha/beta hydrolase [Alkalihalobacterium bogoriense]